MSSIARGEWGYQVSTEGQYCLSLENFGIV